MGYRVVAGVVSAETKVQGKSRAVIDFPRGSTLPDDVPDEQIQSFLAQCLIEATGEVAPPEPEAVEVDLSELDKDGLLAYADAHEIQVDRRLGEDKLRAAIQEAE